MDVVIYSPLGECIRLAVISYVAGRGKAALEELEEVARKAGEYIQRLGFRYDWRIWPRLVAREIAVENGVASLTWMGKEYIQEIEEIETWLERRGVDPDRCLAWRRDGERE